MKITQEMVEKSAMEALGKVRPHIRELESLAAKASQVVQGSMPPRRKIIKLHEIRDKIITKVAPFTACKRGCSYCCNIAVTISSLEAKEIADYTGITPITIKDTDLDKDAAVRKYLGVVCPFLKDGGCSIYEVRPSACRTHLNLSTYPQACDLKNEHLKVPNIDFGWYWLLEAYTHLELGATFADIREFFPTATPHQP